MTESHRRAFVEALRACLGLAPLYDNHTKATDLERFYRSPAQLPNGYANRFNTQGAKSGD